MRIDSIPCSCCDTQDLFPELHKNFPSVYIPKGHTTEVDVLGDCIIVNIQLLFSFEGNAGNLLPYLDNQSHREGAQIFSLRAILINHAIGSSLSVIQVSGQVVLGDLVY
jgi:hypothetical protein